MTLHRHSPRELATRLSRRMRRSEESPETGAFRRETFVLPRMQARAKAHEWFERFPKAAYATEIEFWRELPDDTIEFTIRRLPTAD